MTRQDWRDLAFWMAVSGAFLTVYLMMFNVRDIVMHLLTR